MSRGFRRLALEPALERDSLGSGLFDDDQAFAVSQRPGRASSSGFRQLAMEAASDEDFGDYSDNPPSRLWSRRTALVLVSALTAVAGAAFMILRATPRPAHPAEESHQSFINKVTASEQPEDCVEYPHLAFIKVINNNLGGQGPDLVENQDMTFLVQDTAAGDYYELHVDVDGSYIAAAPRYNGCSDPNTKRCDGSYGTFNLRAGTSTTLRFRLFSNETKEVITLRRVAITFYDLDEGKNHENRESVSASGFDKFLLTNTTELEHSSADGKDKFLSTRYGDGLDNPNYSYKLTKSQQDEAVTLFYKDTPEIVAGFEAGAGAMPRFFTFILRPSLPCEKYLMAPLHVGVGQTGVRETGVFQGWMVSEGQVVKTGDPLGTVIKTDPLTGETYAVEVKAPCTGRVVAMQPFEKGEKIEHRIEDQPIMILSQMGELPVEPGDEAVLTPGSGMTFVEYAVDRGDHVKEGATIAIVQDKQGNKQNVVAHMDGTVKSVQLLLEEGQEIDSVVPSGVLAVIEPKDKLPPLEVDDDASVLVEAPDGAIGGTLQEWKAQPGDHVQEGDTIAIIKGPNGEEEHVVAPATGTLTHLQTLHPGDKISESLPDQGMAVIVPDGSGSDEGLLKLESDGEAQPASAGAASAAASTGVSAQPGDLLLSWKKRKGDSVMQAEIVAAVRRNGEEVGILSPMDGTLQFQQPLQDGDAIQGSSHSPLFTVRSYDVEVVFPNAGADAEVAPRGVGMAAEEGDVFLGYSKDLQDYVVKGEPIAVIERSGKRMQLLAPTDGRVTFQQALSPFNAVTTETSDPFFVVDPKQRPLTSETGVVVEPGSKLVRWTRTPNDVVQKGEEVAVIEQDGQETPLLAPSSGTLVSPWPLQSGDAIGEGESTLFIIQNSEQMQPSNLAFTLTPGDTLESWDVGKNHKVDEGGRVALVQGSDEDVGVAAMVGGRMLQTPEVQNGQVLDDEASLIYILEQDGPLVHPGTAMIVEADDKVLEWKKEIGDVVKAGDEIAVIERKGQQIHFRWSSSGHVSFRQEVGEGELIGEDKCQPLFIVMDSKYQPPSRGLGLTMPEGFKLAEMTAAVNEPVHKGDEVAVIENQNTQVPIVSPVDGFVSFHQPIEPGDTQDDGASGPFIIIDEATPDVQARCCGTPVRAEPGDVFVGWDAGVNRTVGKNAVIAKVKRDGEVLELPAPHEGHVSFQQPLQPGDVLTEVNNNPLFLVDPREAPWKMEPSLNEERAMLPPLPPGFVVTRFNGWLVNPEDAVKQGDAIALVEQLQAGSEGARRLAATQISEVLAPKGGCVLRMRNFEVGQLIEPSISDGSIATVGACPNIGPDWIWWFLLFFLLCCCSTCCIFISCKKRKGESFARMTYIGTPELTGDRPTPHFDKPVTEAAPPPPKGTRFDFRDEENNIHTYYFDRRPLGIVYHHALPMRVDRLKFNSYAKFMGVQENYVLTRIGEEDVTNVQRYRTDEDVKSLIDSKLQGCRLWPLRLDFLRPVDEAATLANLQWREKPISYYVTEQPIGMEFSQHVPIIIKKVHDQGHAKNMGIQEKWKLDAIGNPLVKIQDFEYKEVMRMFRDAVSQLDPADDQHAPERWQTNLGGQFLGSNANRDAV